MRLPGTVLKDLMTEPVGQGSGGKDVYLGDIWPSSEEIHAAHEVRDERQGLPRELHQGANRTRHALGKIRGVQGATYTWPASTTLPSHLLPRICYGFDSDSRRFRAGRSRQNAVSVQGARVMALFGDSITTDHISPAGSIRKARPLASGCWQQACSKADFNSYGARRGNHEVMMRGTLPTCASRT